MNFRDRRIITALDLVIEYGVYLYVFALFNRGTTALSSLGLYLPLLAWIVKHAATAGRGLGYLRHPLALAVAAFCILTLVSAIYAPDPAYSLDSYRKSVGTALALMLVIGDVFRSEDRLKRLLWATAFSGAYVTGLNIHLYAREFLELGRLADDIHAHRWFSDAAVFFTPFTLAAAMAVRGWKRAMAYALFVLQAALLFPTGARGAWVAFAAALALWLFVRFDRKLLVATGFALLLVAVAAATVLPSPVLVERVRDGFTSPARMTGTWGPSLEMIRERPLAGYGYGKEVFNGEFNRRAPLSLHWSFRQSMGPHSNYLEVAFAGGLLALGAMLYAYGRILLDLFRSVRAGAAGHRDWLALAVLCAFVAFYLIRGMVESSRWQPFGVLAGMALALLATGPGPAGGRRSAPLGG